MTSDDFLDQLRGCTEGGVWARIPMNNKFKVYRVEWLNRNEYLRREKVKLIIYTSFSEDRRGDICGSMEHLIGFRW
jgi:hypothetical protein